VFLGSSNNNAVERHNERVTIRGCRFDGVNNKNRNGVSVIDGTDILIENCEFVNFTTLSMPGGIDVEPDGNAFARIVNIRIIGNTFKSIGGFAGAISVYLPLAQSAMTLPSSGVEIIGNHIQDLDGDENGIFVVQVSTGTASSTYPNSVLIEGNVIRGTPAHGIEIAGLHGVTISNNYISDAEGAPIQAGVSTWPLYDVMIDRNYFYHCDTLGIGGLKVSTAAKVTISRNTFNALGKSDGTFGYAIDFDPSVTTSYVTIRDNTIIPGSRTLQGIVKEAAHTFTQATNAFISNDLGGLSNAFVYTSTGSELSASSVVDVTSIANGASYTSAGITVTGAALGDYVVASSSVDVAGLSLSGYVSATDTVKFVLVNNTGGAVDLASATYRVKVTKR